MPILHDIVFAARSWLRRPSHAVVALLTLGLGVGATTAIFSVLNGVLLKPLDYPESDRVVVLWDRLEGERTSDPSAPNLEDWTAASRSFEALAGVWGAAWSLTDDGVGATRVFGGRMTPSLLPVLGIEPVLGRSFTEEETHGEHFVALISHGLWNSRFGGSADVLERTITLDGARYRVVGVLPDVAMPMNQAAVVMTTPGEAHVWLPVDRTNEWYQRRTTHMTLALGRLKSGVTMEQAQSEMSAIAAALAERHPAANAGRGVLLRPIREEIVGDVRRDLLLVLGAVTLVLLVACANLASLMLARALEREREVAVRAALGAGTGRLIRLALVEVALLGVGGAVIGGLVAIAGTHLLLELGPADLPRRAEIAVDPLVLGFAIVLAITSALLAGVLPARRMAASDPQRALQSGSARTGAGARGHGLRGALVVGQLGMAVVLLACAGLLLRSFTELLGRDPGVAVEDVIALGVLLPGPEYDDALRAGAYHTAALEAAHAVPGVRDAALAYDVPLETTWSEGFSIVGRPAPQPGTGPSARFRPVGTGYFELLDVPVLAGRTFGDADRLGAPGVAIVNRALAEQYFAGDDPVGRRIRNGTPRANFPAAPEEFEIVGVVENVAFSGPRAGPQPALYVPLGQFPITYFQVLARTDVAPVSLVRSLADAVRGLDPSVPIPDAVPLATVQSRMLARDRFLALLAGLFAAVALAVAAGGVYGVLSYAAAARRREMGVRQALGADSLAVLRLMLGSAVRLAAAGLVVGLVGAIAASRILASTLYGVRPTDPLVLAGVLLTLLLVALVAGLVPALRTASIDPGEALRVE